MNKIAHTPRRTEIASKVRRLRGERRWTQAELARHLDLSQSRLSEIERGQGSFTAEQFLTILRLFNVPVTHFAPQRKRDAELQNALARLGAKHLKESQDVLPSELLDEVGNVVWEALVTAESPRHVTALAPVLVRNIDRVSLEKLRVRFHEAGLEHRLGWLVENVLDALRRELRGELARRWAQEYRRAELVLGQLTSLKRPERGDWVAHDLLDKDVVSKKSLEEVMENQSAISGRWGIATAITVDDFVEALRASRGAG